MTRALLWILGGLLLGAIIHIVTILGLPRVAENDAWARVAGFGPEMKFANLPRVGPGMQPLPLLDPALEHAVCRFSLEDAPVRIRAALPDTFWSVALFGRRGINLYNLNDHALGQKPLDLLVATAEQVAQIRENPPEDFGDIIILDWKEAQGFAVLRVFAPSSVEAVEAEAAIGRATCLPQPLP